MKDGSNFQELLKMDFTYKPVGIKYLLNHPVGLDKFDKSLSICQMFREAQKGEPFYAGQDNFACMERVLLGMIEAAPTVESGQIGAKERIYQEARANRRIYQYVPRLARGTVRNVCFATVDKLTFDPDVLIITANIPQAEIILRALSYSTGKPLSTKWTPVLSCAWIFVYPFISGEVNYTVTGLGYGIRVKKMFPEGMMLISVPYDQVPMLLHNLSEMDWTLPIDNLSDTGRKEYSARVNEEIMREYLNG